jgi:hypothetical protein
VISALRRLKKRTIIVHLLNPSGASLQGILAASYRDAIVLRHVRHLDEKADLEGDIVIPRERIDFYQTTA